MRPLIAANWKMHGDLSWASKPADFSRLCPPEIRAKIDVLICPPFPFIAALSDVASRSGVLVGAQDCHAEPSGPFTGSVSSEMVRIAGAGYVIVGHSERRAAGETNAMVKTKAYAAHRAGLIPIICTGEPLNIRESGKAEHFVESQLRESLPENKENIVIAYEPIWAIGTGKTPSAEDIAAMHAHIRGLVGSKIRILYGGSVKPGNAEAILGTKNVNGALIGGASLEMDSLAKIAKAAL
jgi:triosephosphate isomerase